MATANSQLGAALVSDIGAPGTHLRPVRDRKIRVESAKKLREGALEWPPAVRLRAILAIGKIPPAELITTEVLSQALPPEDCARNLSKLTRRMTLVDSHNALDVLKASSTRLIDSELPLFATSLEKATIQWRNRKDQPSAMDAKSADSFASLLETLIWSFKSSPSSKGKRRRSIAMALITCVKVLLVNAQESNTRNIRWRCLAILQAAEQSMSQELGEALDSPDVGASLDSVIQAAVNDIGDDARSGKTEQFRKSGRVVARITRARPTLTTLLDSLWSDRGILTVEIQHDLAELTGRTIDSPKEAQLPDAFPESVSSVQLASALTRSWAASRTSPEAEQAYLELSSVLSNFFGIDMHGAVGETAVFDPRIHELLDSKRGDSDQVKIVRPRVELTDGGTVRILLKALVAPVS